MAFQLPKIKTFAEATAVTRLSSHQYLADFPHDWCIGTVPHGGYVTACFLRVASTHFNSTLSSHNQPHTIALHLDFLRRTQVGPALFTVHDTKVGRQASVIHVSLSQPTDLTAQPPYTTSNSREEVVGSITNSNFATESGITLPTDFSFYPPAPPRPVDFTLLQAGDDEHWHRQPPSPFAEFRKGAEKVAIYVPRGGQAATSLADEWLCFRNGERFTDVSLGFVSDMWPIIGEAHQRDSNISNSSSPSSLTPEALDKQVTYWYPTLLLNLDIKKALPSAGVEWLFARVRAKQIKNGRMDFDVVIMDQEGDIVALSSQVALVLGVERNIKQRRYDTSKI